MRAATDMPKNVVVLGGVSPRRRPRSDDATTQRQPSETEVDDKHSWTCVSRSAVTHYARRHIVLPATTWTIYTHE